MGVVSWAEPLDHERQEHLGRFAIFEIRGAEKGDIFFFFDETSDNQKNGRRGDQAEPRQAEMFDKCPPSQEQERAVHGMSDVAVDPRSNECDRVFERKIFWRSLSGL